MNIFACATIIVRKLSGKIFIDDFFNKWGSESFRVHFTLKFVIAFSIEGKYRICAGDVAIDGQYGYTTGLFVLADNQKFTDR